MRRNTTTSDVAGGLTELGAGTGIAFMSFLAPIPGLLPCLLLAGVLLIPLLLLAIPVALVLLVVRAVRRMGQATPARTSTGSGSLEPSPSGRSAIVRSGPHVQSAG